MKVKELANGEKRTSDKQEHANGNQIQNQELRDEEMKLRKPLSITSNQDLRAKAKQVDDEEEKGQPF